MARAWRGWSGTKAWESLEAGGAAERAPGIVYRLAWIGSALLLLRFAAALGQTAYLIAVGRFRVSIIGIWDWWFALGAILFSLSTWRSSREGLGRRAA